MCRAGREMTDRRDIEGKRLNKPAFVSGVNRLMHAAVRWFADQRQPSYSAISRNRFVRDSHLVKRLVHLQTKCGGSVDEWKRLSKDKWKMRSAMEICMKALRDYKLSRLDMNERTAEVVEYLYECLRSVCPSTATQLTEQKSWHHKSMRQCVYHEGKLVIRHVGEELWRKERNLLGPHGELVEQWLIEPLPATEGLVTARISQVPSYEAALKRVQAVLETSRGRLVPEAEVVLDQLLRAGERSIESAKRELKEWRPQVLESYISGESPSADTLLACAELLGRWGYWRDAKAIYRSVRDLALPGATKANAILGAAMMEMNEGNYEAHDRELSILFDMKDQVDLDPLTFGRACAQQGWVGMYQGRYHDAREHLTKAKAVGHQYDRQLEGHAAHFLGRVNYQSAVEMSDRQIMNVAVQHFLEAKVLRADEDPFDYRWEALCKEWLGELDGLSYLREAAQERFGNTLGVAHLWLDEGRRLGQEGDLSRAEVFLRDAVDVFADVLRYPKGTADTLRSLAQVYFSSGQADNLMSALELSVASVLIYPYGGNRGTRDSLLLLTNLRTALEEGEFFRQLRKVEERWQCKDGPFAPLGRIVIDRHEVATGFLRVLKSGHPSFWANFLL